MTNLIVQGFTNVLTWACMTNAMVTNELPTDITFGDDITIQDYSEATMQAETITNVVHSDNSRGPNPMVAFDCLVLNCTDDHTDKGSPATERYEDVTISEITTLRFKWLDKWRVVHDVKVIERYRKTWKKKEEWEETNGAPE